MKRITSTLISLVLTCTWLTAQQPLLSLDDVVRGGEHYSDLNTKALPQLQWKDDKHYSYVIDDSTLVIKTIKGDIEAHITTQDLRSRSHSFTSSTFPYYHWEDNNLLCFKNDTTHYIYDCSTQTIRTISIPAKGRNTDLSIPKRHLAYTIDNNLYLANEDQQQIVVTAYEDPNIVCGQTVHRNEFGISKGTFWSPDGQHLAYYIKDESRIHDYPLVDIMARQGEARYIKYPMAGMPSEEVKIAIYSLEQNESIQLKTRGARDHYLTNITWSPDHRCLYVAEINRGQDTMQLNSYDTKTGEYLQTLFTETNAAYVEPQHPLRFLPHDDQHFLWQSRRDGYNHLYLYSTQGELVKQISQGPWEVTKVLGFAPKKQEVMVSTTALSPIERHVFALSLQDDAKRCITQDAGVHKGQLSPEGSYLIDRWSSLGKGEQIDLVSTKNGKRSTLQNMDLPYRDFELGTTELLRIKAADDSTELVGRLILPPHFDREKQYPAIIYVYGGPHSQLINNSSYGNVQMWQHYMAQRGYVMFTLDNRGTSYRGADFEHVIHRQLGQHEMADQMRGYDYLCQQAYIDSTRIGVFGWSFGGFMTTSLMTHYPEAFEAGVAGGPVIDWSNYEVMYGERYMDTPQENPEGYAATNLCHYAQDLGGRLLMIHGAQDPVVVWQHSQKFIRQCIAEGVQLDYFIYPTHEHNVRGKDRVHLMQKITQHFDDNL